MPHRRSARAAAGTLSLALVGWLLVPGGAGAARAAEPFDVNGDGYADLVTGVPGETIGAVAAAGALQVVFGSKAGLTAAGSQLWSRAGTGVAGEPTAYEELGRGVASADFDRDGYADVAVLTSDQVLVIRGGATGLSTRFQTLTPGRLPDNRADVGLRNLVTGDFDADGRTDLAVTATYPARVWVYAGTASGLATVARLSFGKQPSYPTGGKPSDVGDGLAAGDLDGDGFDDLAVGTGLGQIDSDVSGVGAVGGFYVVPGSAAGLRPDRKRFVAVGSQGLAPGGGYVSGAFGHALAIADLDRDGDGDLVVSDPEGSTDKAACDDVCEGVVYLIPGSRNGISVGDRRYWDLTTRWPYRDEDYPEGNDFGARLALGDLDRDGHLDLAIAAPHDVSNYLRPGLRLSSSNHPGNVYVVYGTATGPESRARQIWSQRSRGVPGRANASEGFGSGGLQILDAGRGRPADLFVHTPGDRAGRGSVSVLYGSRAGLRTTGAQLWHQDQPEIAERGEREGQDWRETPDRFGTI